MFIGLCQIKLALAYLEETAAEWFGKLKAELKRHYEFSYIVFFENEGGISNCLLRIEADHYRILAEIFIFSENWRRIGITQHARRLFNKKISRLSISISD